MWLELVARSCWFVCFLAVAGTWAHFELVIFPRQDRVERDGHGAWSQ